MVQVLLISDFLSCLFSSASFIPHHIFSDLTSLFVKWYKVPLHQCSAFHFVHFSVYLVVCVFNVCMFIWHISSTVCTDRLQGSRLNESAGLAFHRHSLIVPEMSCCLLLWNYSRTYCLPHSKSPLCLTSFHFWLTFPPWLSHFTVFTLRPETFFLGDNKTSFHHRQTHPCAWEDSKICHGGCVASSQLPSKS